MTTIPGENINAFWMSDISEVARAALMAKAVRLSLSDGQVVFRQGENNDAVYLVVSGQLEDSRGNADGDQILLRYIRPGHSVGEFGVGLSVPVPNTITALGDTVVLKFKHQDILGVARTYPEILVGFVKTLAGYMLTAIEWLDTSLLSSLHEKVLWRLKFISSYGERQANGWTSVDIAQNEFAEMVGSCRQSVNKELKAMEAADLVRITYRKIEINSDRLFT